MSLSPEWVSYLTERSYEAIHWSSVGSPKAVDAEIMGWARENNWVVFTHDLDFGILLAHTRDSKPSVLQTRAQDVTPEHLGPFVVRALQLHRAAVEAGALVTLDTFKCRVRVLPI